MSIVKELTERMSAAMQIETGAALDEFNSILAAINEASYEPQSEATTAKLMELDWFITNELTEFCQSNCSAVCDEEQLPF